MGSAVFRSSAARSARLGLRATPEQEAIKQTEKLQSELKLTDEQAKIVYEINLRYARERQLSNSRSQAMERIRNKNEEIIYHYGIGIVFIGFHS